MAIDLSMFFTTDEEGEQVELPRPETKSWPDVIQCINHNKGQRPEVVEKFITLAITGDQWDWFESYKQWQAKCEQITEHNDARTPDEETGELPEPYPLPPEPEPPADCSEEYREYEWRAQREHNQNTASVTVNGNEFDADWKSIVTMSEAVDESEPEEMIPWVLRPNPAGIPEEVSREDLGLALHLARRQYTHLHVKTEKPKA